MNKLIFPPDSFSILGEFGVWNLEVFRILEDIDKTEENT